ncbi:hypothetical protein CTDIVETGP_1410 [Clostridium tyrobutyricum DIVETGP]|uniref:CopG-like ribbon-helix-helix domain-containing protein n=1 Tax=Clostridium tyrobutyricum DIVETGP TaxID=1408889 RepID=W6N5J9_CLOTY|nr:hypothetical protein CTK_C02560 [Clostridium tyrobutyricum]CDL91340.1 hypothetical protein CTDIVETGP_1410 [Clostridium tyrobutyricum DIVETGP]
MIKKENIMIASIIPKKVYAMLVKEAEYEDRSVSGMIRKIIKDHYNIRDDE